MNRIISIIAVLSLPLFFGRMAATAADSLYIEPVNFEPGETKQIVFELINQNPLYGFQMDVRLPEGLSVKESDGKMQISLSGRADSSYLLISNVLPDGAIRFGTFSTSHNPLLGNDGPIFSMTLSASDAFEGGIIAVSDIYLIDEFDNDVPCPEIFLEIGNQHQDKIYLQDFQIETGESRLISINLENETPFSAFQTDLYLPDGLTVKEGTLQSTSRTASHILDMKSFPGGRTRITCLSLDGTEISGKHGEVASLEVEAASSMNEGTYSVELRTTYCSTPAAVEYILPPASASAEVMKGAFSSISVTDSSSVAVWIYDENVTLSGLRSDTFVEVYAVDGQLISAVRSVNGEASFPKPASGIYLVRAAAFNRKLMLK